jgi:hypothetical protein
MPFRGGDTPSRVLKLFDPLFRGEDIFPVLDSMPTFPDAANLLVVFVGDIPGDPSEF